MKELRKLNDMVTKIGLKLEKSRYGEKSVCTVEFFNGEKVEFLDKNKQLFDVLSAYKKCGNSQPIVSKQLVEMEKSDTVDVVDSVVDGEKMTFVAVVYELVDGRKYYMFPARFADLTIIDLYYDSYLAQTKTAKKAN